MLIDGGVTKTISDNTTIPYQFASVNTFFIY